MNLKLTEAIMHDWGKFLELSHSSLMMFFLSEIPEAFLPYPKEKIEEALLIAEKHFFSIGDEEMTKNLETVRSALLFYAEDEKAFKSFLERVKNKEFMEKLLEARKKRQEENLNENELEKRLNIK